MNKVFNKESLINLALWIAFGFTSAIAGAQWSVNPVAYIVMFIIVLTMVLREYRRGLREGSEIANSVWSEQMDKLFEKMRKG